MSSPDLQTVVIACPNCGTRYQVPVATLGLSGREVQCAQCGKAWHALAATERDDAMFAPEEEKALDAAFEAAQKSEAPPATPASRNAEHEKTLADLRAAIAPKPKSEVASPAEQAQFTKSRSAFEKRLLAIRNSLPLAKLRRLARLGGGAILVLVLVIGYFARTEIVRQVPELAWLYSAIGIKVNVLGLEFEDTKTLMSLRKGKNVILVTAKIRSIASSSVAVPPVLVTLFDKGGGVLLEWTVIPEASDMEPGEVMEFSSEVNMPPDGAMRVRLSFTTGRGTAATTARVS